MIEVSYFRNRIYLTSHLIIFGLIHCEDLNLSLSSFNTICYSPLIFLIWFLQWFLVVRPLISKLQMIYFALTRFGILIGLLNFMWSPVRTSPSCCTNQTQNCKHQPCALCLRKYLHLRATSINWVLIFRSVGGLLSLPSNNVDHDWTHTPPKMIWLPCDNHRQIDHHLHTPDWQIG